MEDLKITESLQILRPFLNLVVAGGAVHGCFPSLAERLAAADLLVRCLQFDRKG